MQIFRLRLCALSFAVVMTACSITQSTEGTMGLLRSGDARVCIANDVEQTLRGIVVPQRDDAKDYSVTFSEATLESFDKAVSKATCHANIEISGPTGEIVPRTGFDFTVVPSAQDPETFVVAAALDPYANQLTTAIELTDANEERARQDAASQSALIAMVKEGWLIGRWVTSDKGSDSCATGPYLAFGRKHRFGEEGSRGTWRLSGVRLEIVKPDSASEIVITQADQDSFTYENGEGNGVTYRRCMAQDIPPPQAPLANPEGTQDTSGIDAENPVN